MVDSKKNIYFTVSTSCGKYERSQDIISVIFTFIDAFRLQKLYQNSINRPTAAVSSYTGCIVQFSHGDSSGVNNTICILIG